MEEYVSVFDTNLLWAIPLGFVLGAIAMYIFKGTPKKKQPKKRHEEVSPDSDWPDAEYKPDGAKTEQQ